MSLTHTSHAGSQGTDGMQRLRRPIPQGKMDVGCGAN